MSKRPGPKGLLTHKPELMPAAALLLEALCWNAAVFEFGSGGSTLWLAQKAARVVSIEDDARWYMAVRDALETQGTAVELRFVETEKMPGAIDGTGLWDVVFVDCRPQPVRLQAILRARTHVKPGGWLVADDHNFPPVARGISKLKAEGWDVAIVAGTKIHPVRRESVNAATAFCRKPMR